MPQINNKTKHDFKHCFFYIILLFDTTTFVSLHLFLTLFSLCVSLSLFFLCVSLSLFFLSVFLSFFIFYSVSLPYVYLNAMQMGIKMSSKAIFHVCLSTLILSKNIKGKFSQLRTHICTRQNQIKPENIDSQPLFGGLHVLKEFFSVPPQKSITPCYKCIMLQNFKNLIWEC